jgi:hypothetical protein
MLLNPPFQHRIPISHQSTANRQILLNNSNVCPIFSLIWGSYTFRFDHDHIGNGTIDWVPFLTVKDCLLSFFFPFFFSCRSVFHLSSLSNSSGIPTMARRRAQNQRLLPQSRSRRWKKTRRVMGYPSYGSYRRIYFEYGVCDHAKKYKETQTLHCIIIR